MRVASQSSDQLWSPSVHARKWAMRPVPCVHEKKTSSTPSIWIVNGWPSWKSEWTSHRIPFFLDKHAVESGGTDWEETEQSRGACNVYKSTKTLPIDPQLVAIVSYSHLLFLLKGIWLMNKRAVNQTASSTAHTTHTYKVIYYINIYICYLLVYCILCAVCVYKLYALDGQTSEEGKRRLNPMQTFINERVYKILKEKEMLAPYFFPLSISSGLLNFSLTVLTLFNFWFIWPTSSSSCYLKRIIYQNNPP